MSHVCALKINETPGCIDAPKGMRYRETENIYIYMYLRIHMQIYVCIYIYRDQHLKVFSTIVATRNHTEESAENNPEMRWSLGWYIDSGGLGEYSTKHEYSPNSDRYEEISSLPN